MSRGSPSMLLVACFWLMLLGGCGTSDSKVPGTISTGSSAGESGKYRVGVVLPMFGHPFFQAQKRGIEEEAARLGVALDVRDGQDDDQKQIVQTEALVNLRPDAIILCPRDESALVAAVESANRAGIPIITLNRRVNGGTVVTYVGADDVEGGRKQGEELLRLLGPEGGKIIYLKGTPGSSPQVNREKGFKEAIAGHPEIKVAAEVYAMFQEDKAKAVMTGLVQRFQPGDIQAIVAQADEMALPAAEVAQDAGWKVPVIGFNGTAEAFAGIRSGAIHATVLQDAAEQGRLALKAAVNYLQGKTLDPQVYTPLPLVTRENIDQLRPAY